MKIARLSEIAPPPALRTPSRTIEFNDRALVMGVVNVTPDSFSDGGDFFDASSAIQHAQKLLDDGADIVDIGGESTRPGADPVPADEEIARVVPVIEEVRAARPEALISVDTYKARVAEAAVAAGADIVNDISAMTLDPEMAAAVAALGVPLVAMHILGDPKTMQAEPRYDDVVVEVRAWLAARVEHGVAHGIEASQIVLDPGIGFGKTVEHNYQLMAGLPMLAELGHAILLGTSRKSFIGAVLNKPPQERVWGTAATVAWGILAGAHIVRVHDVAEMADVARISEAIRRGSM